MASIGVESWIWYGVVTGMVILRLVSRWTLFKDVRKFQVEDWFMMFVWVLYTILIEFLNICATANTNLIDPQTDVNALTAADIRDRVYGSKSVLVVESMMCTVQWGTKACLLILYWRLTENLRESLLVKFTAGYVLITYSVMMGLYYGYWCRPFQAFWETPTPEIQCATQTHHLIVNLVFNLSSDSLILLIPLPLFIRASLSAKKKLVLIFPFSLGFFTIACAILSKNLSFSQPFSGEWVFWYCREASTAMIVANMPYGWTIVRRVFHVKAFLRRGSSGEVDESGNLRYLSGISIVSPAPDQRPSLAFSHASKRNRLTSLFSSRQRELQSKSEFDHKSRSHANAMRNGSSPTESLATAHNTSDGLESTLPPGSASSDGSAVKEPDRVHAIDPVDKLYHTDDAALELADLKRKASRASNPSTR